MRPQVYPAFRLFSADYEAVVVNNGDMDGGGVAEGDGVDGHKGGI